MKSISSDHMKDNMFPNPSCYRLRQLSKEARNEVAEENKERFAYLTKRFKKYVDEVSLDSHPSANGILGRSFGEGGYNDIHHTYPISYLDRHSCICQSTRIQAP